VLFPLRNNLFHGILNKGFLQIIALVGRLSKNVPAHWGLLCVVASLIVSVIVCESVAGQPFFSGIEIISPSNTTYSSNLPPLIVNVTRLRGSNIYVFMSYSLNGQSNQTIPLTTQYLKGSFMIVIAKIDSDNVIHRRK
jgi:hypothetical protein